MKNFNTKILGTALLSLFLAVNVLSPLANAQGPTGATSDTGGFICDPAKHSILKLLNSFSTSIISTALLHSDALTKIKLFYMGLGMAPSEAMGCANYMASNGDLPDCFGSSLRSLNCAETDEAVCANLMNQYNVGGSSSGSGFDKRSFASSKVSGSLLGYTYFMQDTIKYEPVPVNTAYFFKDYLAKIPVIGETAYAQSYTDYGHTLINSILNMWKVFRNIAYAMMAVIMLWVGFAIITRKRISSQTVVNVQYALPKIVIALVFIALSYPIGALITSFAWTLFNSSDNIITSITGDTAAVTAGQCAFGAFSSAALSAEKLGIGGLVTIANMIMVSAVGAGALLELVAIIPIIVIATMAFAYIKAFWIYLKMVISTATAPLEIALYALPGNDDKLEMWLKQMLSMGLGLASMSLMLKLMEAFTLDILIQAFTPVLAGGSTPDASIISGSLFNVILAPMMMIFGAALAIQMPARIESMIIGKKGR